MYTRALAREQTVRAALAAPDAAPSGLADVHAVVAAYEAVVRHYPASSYSDNALWQAGRLALDAFARFGQTADRDTGIRLLRRLAAGYPSSTLAAHVPELILRANDDAASGRTSPLPQATTGVAAEPRVSSNRLATIRDIRRAVLPDAVRITIELDSEVPFHDERIADPARVFVDLPGTRAAPPLVDQTLRFNADADIVRQVRIGRHPNNTTRVVLDAAGITSYSVYPLYSPYRLVIDCVRPAAVAEMPKPPLPAPTPAPAPAMLGARSLTKEWPRRLPSTAPRATAIIAEASVVDEPPALPKVVEAPPPPLAHRRTAAAASEPSVPIAPPATNVSGGLSMARQLGLGVSRIVIDAGHGGHDPGAKGKGVTEAELVLDVALRLEKLLNKVAGVEVILTRRTDEFIPLPERTAIANREGADLFLSIHANASPNPQARGIETYFLNFANNGSAAAVAARENAASTLGMGELPDFVKAIATNNKVDESRDFATHVQRAMSERLRASNRTLKDLGVKQAPFVVLIGAAMPAVLAEISFVTNPQEAKLLKSNLYRQRIADSLFNAIKKYQTSLKAAPTVALQ
jgi:N-acetylmuramoyl-L-alanine amidase